jgi:hypothetical protein
MSPQDNETECDVDYFNFSDTDCHEWAATAPTSNLVEAISAYFKVLEHDIKSINKDADFADRKFLNELNGIAWNFYELGPWIMEIQDQLNRRVSPEQSKRSPTLGTGTAQ